MKRRAIAFALLLVATSACTQPTRPPRAASAPAAISGDERAAITGVLQQAVQRGDAPGLVALVVDRNGTLYEAAAGKLGAGHDTPMSQDAIFNIASMTKPVTSVAIMMLLEQGALSLEDPVSKHLTGFDNLQVLTRFNELDGTYEVRPAKVAMTIRHLLTHTSGIGYALLNPVAARLQKGTTKNDWELPLLHEPGEKWTYGASTAVLGMIVEKITGTTLEAYYQDHIFKPLGMTDTSFAVPAEKRSRLAAVHARIDGAIQVRTGQAPPATPPVPSRGDAGLYSTARDYGLFIRMLLNGGKLGSERILSERSVKLMSENHIGAIFVEQQAVANPAVAKPFPLGAGHDKFGLGFQIAAESQDSKSYRSAGSLSWAGLFNTEFWIDPQRQLGGVLLIQLLPFYDDGAIRTLREFEAAVYRSVR